MLLWLFVPVFFHASQVHWAIAWNTQQRELKQNRIKQECFAVDGNVELRKFCSDFRRLVVPAQILSAVLLFGMLILGHLFGFAKGLPGLEIDAFSSFFDRRLLLSLLYRSHRVAADKLRSSVSYV